MRPTNLPTTEALNVHKFPKIIEINQNKNYMGAGFKIMSPMLESFKNDKQFCIMVFIIPFGQNNLLKVKRHKMPVLFFVLLRKYLTDSIAQNINLYRYILLYIKMSKEKSC